MRAIVAETAGQLTWQEIPSITPGGGEVLIKVSAAGVNRAARRDYGRKFPAGFAGVY